MTRELYVLRHSKSDWTSNAENDYERPLNSRGQQDAQRLAVWMKQKDFTLDLVVCSTAVRARQTIAPLLEMIGLSDNKVCYEEKLYLANLRTLLKVLRDIHAQIRAAMIVAHNPGLDELVQYLAKKEPPVTEKGKLMTTSCIAHFKMPDDWHNLKHQADLIAITRPKDISQ